MSSPLHGIGWFHQLICGHHSPSLSLPAVKLSKHVKGSFTIIPHYANIVSFSLIAFSFSHSVTGHVMNLQATKNESIANTISIRGTVHNSLCVSRNSLQSKCCAFLCWYQAIFFRLILLWLCVIPVLSVNCFDFTAALFITFCTYVCGNCWSLIRFQSRCMR